MESYHLECTATDVPRPDRACPGREAVGQFLGATCIWERTIPRRKDKDICGAGAKADRGGGERATLSHTLRTTEKVACEPI